MEGRWRRGVDPLALIALAVVGTSGACGPARSSSSSSSSSNVVRALPTSSTHVASCSQVCGNEVNPPTGGPHCTSVAACRKFTEPQPRCQWIHNLEHGHAVLLYNCPEGCPELLAELEHLWEGHRVTRGSRILLTPDPMLPTRAAAVVWGWSWSGNPLDRAAIDEVLSHQDEDAPEAGLPCPQ